MVNVHTDGENITIHVTPTTQSTTVQASGTSTVGAVAGSSTRYYEQLAKKHMEQAGTYANQAGTSATLASEYLDDTREVYSSVQTAGTEAVSLISEATSDSLGSISETTTEALETISQATTTALEAATSASESAGSAAASATEAARIAAEVIESAPRVTVTETTTGATINIEDIHGTSSADIDDGFSPSASVKKVGNKATITITDKDGTTTAEIFDGTGGASSFSQLDGSPYDNTNLKNALDSKQPVGDYATETYVDNADNNLQTQIDAITSQSDVTDVVGTYAELVAYDKPLYVGDIIKVLNDSTQSGARSYYRNTGGTSGAYTFTLIGSESPSYTKAESDTLLQAKQNITDNNLQTTAKTIVGAINEVNAKPSMPSLDEETITTNTNDELQAIGVIEKNAGNVKYDWVGTLAEYTAQDIETLHPEWVCFITDDFTAQAYEAYTKDETDELLDDKLDVSGNTTATSVDGQWVNASFNLHNNVTTTASATYTFDLSSYLPNDGYNYEVIVSADFNRSSGNVGLRAYSDLIPYSYMSWLGRTGLAGENVGGSAIIPVSTSRKLYFATASGVISALYSRCCGYRRLGTNN